MTTALTCWKTTEKMISRTAAELINPTAAIAQPAENIADMTTETPGVILRVCHEMNDMARYADSIPSEVVIIWAGKILDALMAK